MNPNNTPTKPQSRFKPWQIRLFGALVFLVFFVGTSLLVRLVILPAINDKGPSAAATQSYTAPDNSFSVKLPGTPEVKTENVTVQGAAIPLTTYTLTSGNSYWAVSKNTYPPQFQISDVDTSLNGALDGAVGNVKGATLQKRSFGTINGRRAIFGVAEVKNGSQSFTANFASTLDDRTLYSFIASDISETEFKAFTDSFKVNM